MDSLRVTVRYHGPETHKHIVDYLQGKHGALDRTPGQISRAVSCSSIGAAMTAHHPDLRSPRIAGSSSSKAARSSLKLSEG
jgi:hypothetical protein